jgi:hypothetical protein
MIKHIWSIVCSNSIIDSDFNNISLINVIEQLQIEATPLKGGVLPIHLELVSLWVRENLEVAVEGNSRISFLSPSGKILTSKEIPIGLNEKERIRNRLIYEGLPIEEPGTHIFKIEIQSDGEWVEVSSIPLFVFFSPPEIKESQEQVVDGEREEKNI